MSTKTKVAKPSKLASYTETREAWLTRALPTIKEWIIKAGAENFQDPQVSIGLPSRGALAMGKRRCIGECWDQKTTASGKRCVIFISPLLQKPVQVLDVFTHELIHAAVGVEHKHKKPFKKIAREVGLEGKITATIAGEVLKGKLERLAKELGDYPHDALINFTLKKRKPRKGKVLYACENCGQKIRVNSEELMARHYCEGSLKGKSGMFEKQDGDEEEEGDE